MKDQESHNKAWSKLDEYNVKLNDKMMIRSCFADFYKNNTQFTETIHYKGNVLHYKSTLSYIDNMVFQTEQEVNLANAMAIILKDRLDINEFYSQFKYVLRILDIKSEWSK